MITTSIENFKKEFYQYEYPFWWVFDGKHCAARYRPDDDIEQEDILDYSWMQLEEYFQLNSLGGKVKIKLKQSLNAGDAYAITKYVTWGNVQGTLVGTTGQSLGLSQQMGGWQQIQYMMNMQQNFFQSLMDLKQELANERFENVRLAEALEADNQPGFKEELIREGIGAIKEIFRPKPTIQQPTAALGTLGQKDQQATAEAPKEKRKGVSFDQIMIDISAIAKTLPEYHANEITRALAIYVQQNPEQAKMFIGPLVESLRNAQS